ncbi:response regulator [Reichenbachiella ulvae]|uniref:Response regulator n=1 Tax=Reichenbachiella ulvae TaxID=2980104 RepID=A0ABT3D0U2_9BACT|nr:response regulator [Reichenbachiella ulvae]MCV9389446.1 response regulator [Reichenbachiella ulvae]
MRILIVDDSVYSIGLISLVVKKMGHQVVGEAKNGKEAIKLIKEQKPDIITLDNILHDMKGLEVLAGAGPNFDSSKVIVISGTTQADTLNNYKNLGVTEFLKKPFELHELEALINKASDSVYA